MTGSTAGAHRTAREISAERDRVQSLACAFGSKFRQWGEGLRRASERFSVAARDHWEKLQPERLEHGERRRHR